MRCGRGRTYAEGGRTGRAARHATGGRPDWRRALPAPESVKHTEEETFVAPTSTVHYQLMQIWEELLDERPIGIRDNFFYRGGHSLLAARLVNRIEQVFGKKIPLATLFAEPTIEQLASALQQQEDTGPSFPLVAVQTAGSKLSR